MTRRGKLVAALLGAGVIGAAVGAACTGTYAEHEAILGSRVNPQVLPPGHGVGGSGSDEEVIKGNDVNPKYIEDMAQQRPGGRSHVQEVPASLPIPE